MTTITKAGKAPLFALFTVEQLTSLTPYSEAYLRDLESRPDRIRPRFRRIMSRLLGRSEIDLFGGATIVAEIDDNEIPS